MHDWSRALSDLLLEVSEMKKADKKNEIGLRKGDVDMVDWLLAIDFDLGKRAMS